MTHLRIEQNGFPEVVNTKLLETLYNLSNSPEIQTMYLSGELQINRAFRNIVDYLTQTYPDLHITTLNGYYMNISDPAVENVLKGTSFGDGIGVLESSLLSAQSLTTNNTKWTDESGAVHQFMNNSEITSFNELGQMTSCKTIEGNVFRSCTNLTSIDLSNIEYIGQEAFLKCTGLSGQLNLLSLKQILGTNVFSGCKNISSVILGPQFDPQFGQTSRSGMFTGCTNLQTVTYQSNPTYIQDSTFTSCKNLTTINGISNVTNIGESAFFDCRSLQPFDLSNITTLGKTAFRQCYNCEFTGFENISSYGDSCFNRCSNALKDVVIKADATVGNYAFQEGGLRTITFKGDFSTGISQFENNKQLTSITFEGTVSKLGLKAFNQCSSLTSVDLSNVLSFWDVEDGYGGGGQFSQCTNLSSVILNSNITKLPPQMFSYIDANLTITIPASVTSIGDKCFYGTYTKATILAETPPQITGNPFFRAVSIKVPANALNTYLSDTNWSQYNTILSAIT